MSLIVSVRTDEGVVMASDSRVTVSTKEQRAAHFSDTTYKTFCLGEKLGVSTCGMAHLQGKSIAGWMQVFENERFNEKWSVLNVAQDLATFFLGLKPPDDIIFHLGGYEKTGDSFHPVTYRVVVRDGIDPYVSPPGIGPGMLWDGMTETLSRILKSCFIVDRSKAVEIDEYVQNITDETGVKKDVLRKNLIAFPNNTTFYPQSNIAVEFFTLQDAINFAKYAIKTTIDTIRFKSEPLTVGEPIDILVIKSTAASWIAHKELHA